jgi:hypothetical protein
MSGSAFHFTTRVRLRYKSDCRPERAEEEAAALLEEA